MKLDNQDVTTKSIDKKAEESFIKTIAISFITVFLAELGDKTQIATLLLSAGSGEPILVFIGAALALICTSIIGVILGKWLAEKIPENLLNNIAGIIMLGIGLYLISDVSISNLSLLNLP